MSYILTCIFLMSLSCAQSRDQSAPVYQSGCSEAPSLESIGLVNSRKAHILAITLKATLRNACSFVSLQSSASQQPIAQCNSVTSFPTAERPSCVVVIRPICVRISLISHSSCLTALTDVGKVHIRDPSSCSSSDCFQICRIESLQMPWYTAILGFCRALQ